MNAKHPPKVPVVTFFSAREQKGLEWAPRDSFSTTDPPFVHQVTLRSFSDLLNIFLLPPKLPYKADGMKVESTDGVNFRGTRTAQPGTQESCVSGQRGSTETYLPN
jgi:hypothetical protein